MMTLSTLPQDPITLQNMVLDLNKQVALLLEQVRLLKADAFGAKSERFALEALGQGNLFNSEAVALPEPEKKTKVEAHQRKKPRRKPLPETLPRREVLHDLDDKEKVCGCGREMTRIGRSVTEKLEIIPESVEVVQHVVPKYACKACDGVENEGDVIRSASLPAQILPKSFASPSLLAYLVVSKFVDALPLYRLEQRFKRWNIALSRKTMTDWILKLGNQCDTLVQLLLEDARGAPWIGIDETRIRVVEKKKRRSKAKTGWIWAIHGRQPKPICLFFYHESRSSDFPKTALHEYQGVVVSDDWRAYNFLDKPKDGTPWLAITHALCWTHARRYFDRVIKATGITDLSDTITGRTLARIRSIYALERQAANAKFSTEQLMTMRDSKTRPILQDLQADLIETTQKSAPIGALKSAIHYTLSNWTMLTTCLSHPVPLDNNGTENMIRPFVVGRKNWLFACSIQGAKTNATLYSLAETAKANGWNPYDYFLMLFERLPLAQTNEALRLLLPTHPPPAR